MLTPNFGIEYTLGNKNWNKWTLGISGRINWNTQTKDPTYNVYDLYDGKIELRKYWHGNNPRRVFYWGIYGGANRFNIKFTDLGRRKCIYWRTYVWHSCTAIWLPKWCKFRFRLWYKRRCRICKIRRISSRCYQ